MQQFLTITVVYVVAKLFFGGEFLDMTKIFWEYLLIFPHKDTQFT